MKKQKINKKWHKLTIEAIRAAQEPGIIKYNIKTKKFEVLPEKPLTK